MKYLSIFLLLLTAASCGRVPAEDLISTIDFVQIVDSNDQEALFYYENNWKELREKAVEGGMIHSYELMLTPRSEEAPFDIMLITTYQNDSQYAAREENFTELIEERGDLKLLNEKEPGDFRKVIFGKDDVKHIH